MKKCFNHKIILSAFISLFLAQLVYSAEIDRAWLINKFNELDLAINNGEGYSKSTNEEGFLAWAESYLLEAYLDMYEVTRDSKYLDKFVKHTYRITSNTDWNRKVIDYKGRSVIGWSATKYSKNSERIVWLVHTGMITYPLSRFALIIKNNNLTNYEEEAKIFTLIVKEAITFFDKNWIYNILEEEGYYQFDIEDPHTGNTPEPPMPMPFNQQLAAGRTLILLYKLTGKDTYREKAYGLAKHFKNRLKKDSGGTFVWNYWYDKGLKRFKAAEDIGHGAIDIDFIVLAYRNGIVFNRDDIEGFVSTYIKNVYKYSKYAIRVNGEGEEKCKEVVGLWLELSEFDCTIWNNFLNIVKNEKLSRHPKVMLGIAKLLKYYEICDGKTCEHMEN